jgi:ABC-type transporter Mla MlaB component
VHHILTSAAGGTTSIEVDGSLDVVAAYDLWSRLDGALREGTRVIGIDLTRVTSASVEGVRCLARCRDAAIEAGAVLTLTGCSRPFRADLAAVESARS